MFSVFQSYTAEAPAAGSSSCKSRRDPRNRLVKIPHACTECKRRKIRCDGGHPCGRCTTRGVGPSCSYTRHRERIHPSKQKLEKVSKTLEEYRTIFDRLYPDYEVSHLLSLPRQELLDILNMSNQTPSPTNWLPSPPPNPIPYHQDFDVNPFPPNSFEGVDVSQFVDGGINWVGNGKQLSFLTY